MKKQILYIGRELKNHLPFTIFSVCVGLIIVGILTYFSVFLNKDIFTEAAKNLFHVFHPIHLLLSATATTAMSWRHEKNLIKSIIIGFVASVGICGLSDVLIPFFGGIFLGMDMELHICILSHPLMIMPFVFLGIFTGILSAQTIKKSTIYSHSAHVLVSSMASILYLVSYGLTDWIHVIGAVFVLIILAVIIPCCFGDIVFPLMVVSNKK